jgi:hypothetical protein
MTCTLYALGTINENTNGRTLPRAPLFTFSGGSNTAARSLVDAVYIPSGVSVIPIGDHPLPKITWDAAATRATLRWPDQNDMLDFSSSHVAVLRDGTEILSSTICP